MTVLITGATGLVGREIVKQCHSEDISVNYLTTSREKLNHDINYKGFYWNPEKGIIDTECFKNVDAIINLAGTTISKRWTPSKKKDILESRLQALDLLKHSLFKIEHSVRHLISASAIGIYPDSLTNYYDEGYPKPSTTFLGKVVEEWEAKADEFATVDLTVAKIRIGLVLSENGGALPEMVRPITIGAGAAFGKGTQWQSWIHVGDLARIFVFVLLNKLQGTFNAVAPNPVTNADLITAIAKKLRKPLLLPNIPKFIMKLILGEMHILLYESQRVSSKKIEEKEYRFEYNNLSNALEDIFK